jgi:hypothetical protein
MRRLGSLARLSNFNYRLTIHTAAHAPCYWLADCTFFQLETRTTPLNSSLLLPSYVLARPCYLAWPPRDDLYSGDAFDKWPIVPFRFSQVKIRRLAGEPNYTASSKLWGTWENKDTRKKSFQRLICWLHPSLMYPTGYLRIWESTNYYFFGCNRRGSSPLLIIYKLKQRESVYKGVSRNKEGKEKSKLLQELTKWAYPFF